jgi:hypothetical protein
MFDMKNTPPIIASFPKDNRTYRLALLGSLDRNPLVESHPVVRVALIPLRRETLNHGVISQARSYDARASMVVEVAVGLWPYLKPGTLWRNGKLVSDPPYETEVFQVGPSSRSLTPAVNAKAYFTGEGGEGEEPRHHYYIPFRRYPFPDEGLKARILLLPATTPGGEDVTLITLCHEVFRFYYANSSPLAVALLAGELEDHEIGVYNPDPALTYLDPLDATGRLRLRQKMVDEDAAIAGRIALDEVANAHARDIHPSIVRNKTNHGAFVLDAYPPFAGGAMWRVHGQAYTLAGRRFFLVYWIETCSAAFPFSSLYFSRDNDGRTDGVDDPERPPANWKTKRECRQKEGDAEREVRFDQEPERNEPLTKVTLNSGRFLDLEEKLVEKEEKDEVNFRASHTRRPTDDGDGDFGMGDGTTPSPLDRLSVSTRPQTRPERGQRRRPLSPDLENFHLVLNHLADRDASVELVLLSDDGELPPTGDCSYVPARGAWSYLDRRRTERRRAVVAHVVYNDSHFCLFELEKRPVTGSNPERFATLLLHYPDGSEVERGLLEEVLLHTAEYGGGWPQERELRGLRKRRFFHTSPSVPEFGDRIFDYLKAFVPPPPVEPDMPADPNGSASDSEGDVQTEAA